MRSWAAAAVLALGACAALQPGGEQALAVDAIIEEAVSLAGAPAARQKEVLGGARQAYMRTPTARNRLRLATLLATLPAPLRDEPRAAELLAPLSDPHASSTGRFAVLLAGQIAERQRLARELARLSGEAEDAARERERLARERAQEDRERDQREEALRQQLEALRSIERSILEREEKLRRRQR